MNDLSRTPREVLSDIDAKRIPRRALRLPFVAPRNDTEARIADFWSEVLRVNEVGVDDDFFDLGGDSLHMVQIISRLQREYEVEIPLGDFFDNPTVAQLALIVKQQSE